MLVAWGRSTLVSLSMFPTAHVCNLVGARRKKEEIRIKLCVLGQQWPCQRLACRLSERRDDGSRCVSPGLLLSHYEPRPRSQTDTAAAAQTKTTRSLCRMQGAVHGRETGSGSGTSGCHAPEPGGTNRPVTIAFLFHAPRGDGPLLARLLPRAQGMSRSHFFLS